MSGYEFIIRLSDYASGGIDRIARAAGVARGQIGGMSAGMRTAQMASDGLGRTMGKLRSIILGVFTVGALMGFIGQVTEARSEFEKFQAVLTNTFQSKEIGDGALNMLTKFAAETPFQLNELTGGFIKLVNRGINPTKKELGSLGDLAGSQGKSFDQLVEAVLDAQTGEFERMKEFGIKASKSGDMVTFAFKGVTKTVKNNEQAIKDAIIQYGNMKGVAGSMESVSKTLGGRLSNLQDQWWSLLVAVGGESSGIFTKVLDGIGDALEFLTDHLADISKWFGILWSKIEPVADALGKFLQSAMGASDAASALETFGNIMSNALVVVGWFTTGLTTLIDWLGPFAQHIALAAAEWAILNALIAVTPVGWIIIGIMALITIIGMAAKYTSGWGKSWEALKVIFKAAWGQIKADFGFGVDKMIYGFKLIYLQAKDLAQQIIGTFSKIGDAIKMALTGDIAGALKRVGEDVKTQASQEILALQNKDKEDTKKYYRESNQRGKDIVTAAGNVGITVDTKGISQDFKKMKDQFSGAGTAKPLGSDAYDNFLNTKKKGGKSDKDGASGGKGKGADGITSGGSRPTNITINLAKMQDQIVINTVNAGEGAQKLRQILEEELTRLLGSVSQMQTQ